MHALWGDGQGQGKERDLRRKLPYPCLDRSEPPEMWEMNVCCLSHQACGILYGSPAGWYVPFLTVLVSTRGSPTLTPFAWLPVVMPELPDSVWCTNIRERATKTFASPSAASQPQESDAAAVGSAVRDQLNATEATWLRPQPWFQWDGRSRVFLSKFTLASELPSSLRPSSPPVLRWAVDAWSTAGPVALSSLLAHKGPEKKYFLVLCKALKTPPQMTDTVLMRNMWRAQMPWPGGRGSWERKMPISPHPSQLPVPNMFHSATVCTLVIQSL